jgi:hypothetical protein
VGFGLANVGLAVLAEYKPRVRDPMSGDKLARLSRSVRAGKNLPIVLFLGSSRTGLAFHALRAEDRLREMGVPTRCYNLGIPAAGPITELITLQRALTAGVRPSVVLLEIHPAMLHVTPDGPRERAFLTGDRLSAEEVKTAARFGYSWDEISTEWVNSRVRPWWAYRFPIWGRVAPSWLSFAVRGDWGRTADDGGWNIPIRESVTADERSEGEQQARAEYAEALAQLTPGGGATAAIVEILALCKSQGIIVRLVLLPEATSFRSLYGVGAEERLQNFLATLDAPIHDARGWLSDDDFVDGHHVLRQSSASFTDRLVSEVLWPTLAKPEGVK